MDGFRAFGHSAVEALLRLHEILTPQQRAQVSEHARQRTPIATERGEPAARS